MDDGVKILITTEGGNETGKRTLHPWKLLRRVNIEGS